MAVFGVLFLAGVVIAAIGVGFVVFGAAVTSAILDTGL